MNINIYNPYIRDELYHHGIAGQKWGKRNGPPYPLAASAHSVSEEKAGWRESVDKRRQKVKDKERLNKDYYQMKYPDAKKLNLDESASYDEYKRRATAYTNKHTKNQQKVQSKIDSELAKAKVDDLWKQYHDYGSTYNNALDKVAKKYGHNDPKWEEHAKAELTKAFGVKRYEDIPKQFDPTEIESKIFKKYASEMRGAILKDLSREDTEYGRQLLYEMGIYDYDNPKYEYDDSFDRK